MAFALVCVALVLIVLAAVSLPLLSAARDLPARGQYDRAVYRDQLREVERDVARGVLGPDEANAARLEIQRRLLAVEVADHGAPPRPARSPVLAVAAGLFLILGAGGLYWRLGAPMLSDAPFAARPPAQADAPQPDMKQAAARMEQKLAADPSNAGGWVLYARTLSILGEWQKAVDAYRHAIDLGVKNGDIFAGYGEMQVMVANGIVSPAAHDAFATAVAADATNAVARYYLALADGQAGEDRRAIDAWLELAAGLPEDSRMREEIARRIAEAAKAGGIEAPPLPKGLPAEAPKSGPASEQMIAGMIEKLAARLRDQPNDLDGWSRLGRAYAVEGDTAHAVDAYDHAATLKPGDPEIKLQIVAALLSGSRPGEAVPPRAIALLTEVAAVAPDAPEVLWYLGVVAVHQGRLADARDDWTRLLASLPPDGEDDKMVRAALAELKAK